MDPELAYQLALRDVLCDLGAVLYVELIALKCPLGECRVAEILD